MSGLFGTTAGPWKVEDGDSEFAHDYDVWISGGGGEGDGDMIVCACWNEDKRAIAQVPAMLELVEAVASETSLSAWLDHVTAARKIAAELEGE